ncbi:MAG: SPOR domain-containing protein [Glaciimonas sp.]|nr:SPOR domain-containing protein [Glaciimonas sp.]
MLKFIFWILLLANGGLLAFNWGALDDFMSNGREPQRVQRQIHPEQLILLTAAAVAATVPVALPAEPAPPVLIACTEIGNFPLALVQRFEERTAELALGDRQSRQNVREVGSYMVYIPPQGGQAGAQQKVAELRQRRVTSFFVMQDNADPKLRWGISLGVYKTESAAKNLLDRLKQQGVQSARIGTRSVATGNVVFQLRDLDPAGKAALDRIAADFPEQRLRNCE